MRIAGMTTTYAIAQDFNQIVKKRSVKPMLIEMRVNEMIPVVIMPMIRANAIFDFTLRSYGAKGPSLIILQVLEPISKLPEQQNDARQLHEAEEICGVVLPTNQQPTLPLQPGKEPLHNPAPLKSAQPPAVLGLECAPVGTMRRYHFHAVLSQLLVQAFAVVGAITDQVFRLGFDHVEIKTQLHQRHLVMVGGVRADR